MNEYKGFLFCSNFQHYDFYTPKVYRMESENVGLLKKESPFPGADFQATFQTSGVYMQLLLKPSELLKQTTWDEQKLQSDIPWILDTHDFSYLFTRFQPTKTIKNLPWQHRGGSSVGFIGNWERWRFLVATAGEFDNQTSLQYMIQIAQVPELKQTFDLHKCSSWICSKQLKQYVMFCCQVFFEGQIEVENMVRQSLQVVAKVHDVP